MKLKLSHIISLIVLVAVIAAGTSFQVYAAAIISVTPDTIVNDVANTITVSGTGFDNTAAVLLDGWALDTIFLNDQTLTATIPSGVLPGLAGSEHRSDRVWRTGRPLISMVSCWNGRGR